MVQRNRRKQNIRPHFTLNLSHQSMCSLLGFDHSDFSHSKSVTTATFLSTGIWFGPTGRLLEQSYCVSLIWVMGWYLSLRLTRAQPQTSIHCLETSRQSGVAEPAWFVPLNRLLLLLSHSQKVVWVLFSFWCACWGPDLHHHCRGQSFVYTPHIFCLIYFRRVWGTSEKKPVSQIPKPPEGTSVSVSSWHCCRHSALWLHCGACV